jgi:HK97 family phage major capsid protein
MDTKSTLNAELSAISAKLAVLVSGVKSSGRDLTDAEAAAVEQDTARIVDIKSQLNAIERGEKNAALTGNSRPDDQNWEAGINGRLAHQENASGEKGFISPASIKSMARAGAADGIKALVAGGSSTTPVALETNPIPLGQPNLGLLSVVPTKVRETPNYSYLRQTVRTNNAAVVAPGATKPTSVYTVATVPGSLAVVAHLSEYVDKYLLEDNDDLERFLAGELTNGVIKKVTADAIAAFAATSGIQTVATSASYTPQKGIDGVYAGASLVGDLGYTPNLVILSRTTYDGFRLSKDGDQNYLAGSPFAASGTAGNGLWGLTTLVSSDVAAGTALVLDTSQVGVSTDRQGIETVWDAISGFAKNEVRARTEGRFGYDVFSPAAIAKVTFTA